MFYFLIAPYDKDDEANRRNVVDFSLLDFNMMFKFITINEVLIPVLQQLNADTEWVGDKRKGTSFLTFRAGQDSQVKIGIIVSVLPI